YFVEGNYDRLAASSGLFHHGVSDALRQLALLLRRAPRRHGYLNDWHEIQCSSGQFVPGKEKAQLEARRIFRVRAVNSVMLDAGGPLFADRAFFSVSRIRCSHQLAEIGNGILFLQRQHDNWATGHEIRKRVKERLAGMNGVELLRLMLGN